MKLGRTQPPTRALSRFAFAAVASLITGAALPGCSCSTASLVCDDAGENCEVCDGLGCSPADATATSTTSGAPAGSGAGGFDGTGGAGAGGAIGTGGSAPACEPEVAACSCETTADCNDAPGTQCVAGLCVDGCDFSYECGVGKVCFNGACNLGCDAESPCPEPGTFCDKGACVPDAQNPECTSSGQCAAGEVCASGFCTTSCTASAACASGEICDAAKGVCVPDPSPKPGCAATVECTGLGQVCGEDGYCHYPCETTNACKLIDNRFVECSDGFCKTAEEAAPECSLAQPCPAGKDCVSNKCL